MVGVPRSLGCSLCRKRRVKCDEQKPTCGNCQKYGVDCPGYEKDVKFVSGKHQIRQRRRPASAESPMTLTSNSLASSPPVDDSLPLLGGLLVHLIPSLAVILLPPPGAVYSFILEVKGYPAQMSSLAIGCGLLWLRSRRPDLKRPFKAWRPAVYLPIMLSSAATPGP